MKYLFLVIVCLMTFFQRPKAQGELLKLTSEVLSASDDLKSSMEKLQGLKDALEDIKDKKNPKNYR